MVDFRIHISEKARKVAPILQELKRVVYEGKASPSSLLVFLGGGDGRDIDVNVYPENPNITKERRRHLDMRLYAQVDAIVTSSNMSIYSNENDRARLTDTSPEAMLKGCVGAYIKSLSEPYTILTTKRGVEPARKVLTEMGIDVEEVVELP